jgi:transcriptional regulator with XRE-family HTH domain
MSTFRTPAEIQADLGERIRALRLKRNLSQGALALKAGLARNSIVNLENGSNASLATFIAALSALDAADIFDPLALAEEGPSPIEIFHKKPARQRASRTRRPRKVDPS